MRLRTADVPQADDLDRVIDVVEAVQDGAKRDVEIAAKLGEYDPRQGRYYRLAAELLGLITNEANNSEITKLGRDFVERENTEREALLPQIVLNSKLFRALMPFLKRHPDGITRSEILEFVLSLTDLAETTVERRLTTITNWLERVRLIYQDDGRIFLNAGVIQKIGLIKFRDVDEPLIPKSMREYSIIPERTNAASKSIRVMRDEAKMERANAAHRQLVKLVAGRIQQAGFLPVYNPLIDLAAQVEDQQFIFEMKSSQEKNFRAQIRKGLSQLYEYRYLQDAPDATLVLVIEKSLPPTIEWMQEYLETDRNIKLIWDGNNDLHASSQTREVLGFLWQSTKHHL